MGAVIRAFGSTPLPAAVGPAPPACSRPGAPGRPPLLPPPGGVARGREGRGEGGGAGVFFAKTRVFFGLAPGPPGPPRQCPAVLRPGPKQNPRPTLPLDGSAERPRTGFPPSGSVVWGTNPLPLDGVVQDCQGRSVAGAAAPSSPQRGGKAGGGSRLGSFSSSKIQREVQRPCRWPGLLLLLSSGLGLTHTLCPVLSPVRDSERVLCGLANLCRRPRGAGGPPANVRASQGVVGLPAAARSGPAKRKAEEEHRREGPGQHHPSTSWPDS